MGTLPTLGSTTLSKADKRHEDMGRHGDGSAVLARKDKRKNCSRGKGYFLEVLRYIHQNTSKSEKAAEKKGLSIRQISRLPEVSKGLVEKARM